MKTKTTSRPKTTAAKQPTARQARRSREEIARAMFKQSLEILEQIEQERESTRARARVGSCYKETFSYEDGQGGQQQQHTYLHAYMAEGRYALCHSVRVDAGKVVYEDAAAYTADALDRLAIIDHAEFLLAVADATSQLNDLAVEVLADKSTK